MMHRRGRRLLAYLAASPAVATLTLVASAAASTATLRLSVTPDQVSGASVLTVTAAGLAGPSPTVCPAGVGCELNVFVIRTGSCPAQPQPLVTAEDRVVVFLTSRGLPALVGTTAGPFKASGDFFLDGAPTATGQGNASDGYNASRWGTFIFCGYLQDARATATFTNRPPDELDVLGPARLRASAAPIDVYSATCAAPPCRVELSERAFAAGRDIPALDADLPSTIDRRSSPTVVALPQGALDEALLERTIRSYGSVALHFTSTVTDARGYYTSAERTIVLVR
jgi:hypothetical protein